MLFLESCLLVLLRRKPDYGYRLMEGLQAFGFSPEEVDISLVYRALRDLEEAGLVESHWSQASLGPQRRVYTLTPEGEEALAGWMEALRQWRKDIEALEQAYATSEAGAEKTV